MLGLPVGCGGDEGPEERERPSATAERERPAGADAGGEDGSERPAGEGGESQDEDAVDEEVQRRRQELGIRPGADNSLQTFGEEPDQEEESEVVNAMRAYFAAVAEEDFGTACGWFAAELRASHEQLINRFRKLAGKPPFKRCSELDDALRQLTENSMVVADARKAAEAEILRIGVEEDTGRTIVIYRTKGGRLMHFPMVRQDDRWRVFALGPTPITAG